MPEQPLLLDQVRHRLQLEYHSIRNEEAGIRTVQELLGHKYVNTTMIYTHVLSRGGKGVNDQELVMCWGGDLAELNRSRVLSPTPKCHLPSAEVSTSIISLSARSSCVQRIQWPSGETAKAPTPIWSNLFPKVAICAN